MNTLGNNTSSSPSARYTATMPSEADKVLAALEDAHQWADGRLQPPTAIEIAAFAANQLAAHVKDTVKLKVEKSTRERLLDAKEAVRPIVMRMARLPTCIDASARVGNIVNVFVNLVELRHGRDSIDAQVAMQFFLVRGISHVIYDRAVRRIAANSRQPGPSDSSLQSPVSSLQWDVTAMEIAATEELELLFRGVTEGSYADAALGPSRLLSRSDSLEQICTYIDRVLQEMLVERLDARNVEGDLAALFVFAWCAIAQAIHDF